MDYYSSGQPGSVRMSVAPREEAPGKPIATCYLKPIMGYLESLQYKPPGTPRSPK